MNENPDDPARAMRDRFARRRRQARDADSAVCRGNSASRDEAAASSARHGRGRDEHGGRGRRDRSGHQCVRNVRRRGSARNKPDADHHANRVDANTDPFCCSVSGAVANPVCEFGQLASGECSFIRGGRRLWNIRDARPDLADRHGSGRRIPVFIQHRRTCEIPRYRRSSSPSSRSVTPRLGNGCTSSDPMPFD